MIREQLCCENLALSNQQR